MIWALLFALGVPLWVCAAGITTVVFRNRALRRRYGDIPVRVRAAGKARWTRGHALWVSDVFAWRGSPAAWKEELVQVTRAELRPASDEEREHLHRLSGDPVVVALTDMDGAEIEIAVAADGADDLLGPFAHDGGVPHPAGA